MGAQEWYSVPTAARCYDRSRLKPDATRSMSAGEADASGQVRAFLVLCARSGAVVVDLPLDEDVVVGRDAEADLRIDDELVSRRHALVRFDGALLMVRDLGSRNGTRVN